MSTANRHVRIGIVYRGSVIAETTLDRRIDVSCGLRASSTVLVSAKEHPDFADSIELLLIEQGQYYLVVPSDPTARISLRGAATDSEPRTIRGKRCIPIEGAAGGSLAIGDIALMFQFVRGDTQPTMVRTQDLLRIGLVYDERLISDTVYPDAKQVTIGTSKNCTVVLPEEDYQGPAITFINNKDGSATLRAPVNMKVMVAIDSSPLELKELQAKGKARQEGNEVICHLPLNARGRAVMGAHKVLFQVVKQSVTVPMVPTPPLLKRITGPILNEPTWSISFITAVVLVTAVVGQAVLFQKNTGVYLDKAKSTEEAAKTIIEVEVAMKEEEKKEEEKEPEKDAPPPIENKEEPKPDKKEDKKVDKKDDKPAPVEKAESTGKTTNDAEKNKHDREVITNNSVAGALMDKGGAATKLFADDGGDDGGTVQANRKAFGGEAAPGEGAGPGGALKLEGAGSGGKSIEGGLKGEGKGFKARTADVAKVAAPEKKEAVAQVKLSGLDGDDAGGSKGDVGKVIARKAGAVKQCYEGALRDNPDIGGKVKVSFTVGTAGTVTDVNVSGAEGGFADCIKGKFMGIRGLPILASPSSFSQSYVFSKN